ncbi:MAG: alginate lyase family protein [Halomonas sp.]|jgi:poly(beta-D-mannuronate) lyase|uniref:alginate lyase family protein n=1 Tax=Halomonas sp. MCCC 1A11057 TaxID=2733482 RepID=UPI001F31671C|nr:alginate lyase family protein [Halomonas sp. MCCC 1A11057]MCE8034359.1 poly(beta-D-mannuronate) lyase [Halomonas sp. MCCC 1A11057]MDX5435396.1 alginate lyase family protein [Halomonas sp.]
MTQPGQDPRHCYLRQLSCTAACLTLALGSIAQTKALTLEEREQLDLSAYEVVDPDASYFNVEERMEVLHETDNSLLMQHREELAKYAPSCRQRLEIPTITEKMRIPGFYPTPDDWKLATEPLFKFEDTVSELAGAYVASGNVYYAECLVKFLDRWAQDDALLDFHYHWEQPQAWFSLESMIFAAGMAYSVARPFVEGMQEERARVEEWLNELASVHMEIEGADSSCCNNHFYRRALYAAMVGVLTEDDAMFRFGVSAIYSALHDMTEEGAFPLEMERGRRATHYQNYALLYLVPIMEIVARQGYDIYEYEVDGGTMHDAVDFAMDILEDPSQLGDLAPREQYTGFLKDNQYFAWMEMYRARFGESRFDDFLASMRPIYNRGAGGYATLYFMDPEAQQHIRHNEEERQTRAFEGLSN